MIYVYPLQSSRWLEHVLRMDEYTIVRRIHYSALVGGTWGQERARKT